MSRSSPFTIRLSDADRAVLEHRVAEYSAASHAEVVRARIVLLSAAGLRNIEIAGRVGVHVDVVWLWRKRFCHEGLAGLVDRARSGRPRVLPSRPARRAVPGVSG